MLTLDGKPIHLTDAAGGVEFDLGGSGTRTPVAWTRAGSSATFLVLDLDGDGAITTGAELLGMPVGAPRHQKPSASDNSFTLLAAYDAPAQGGNGDGVISPADAVFSRLRLWVDANHDGVSQPAELTTLATAGIVSIDLSYQTTGRRDGHGNFFRYRGVVHLTSGRTVAIWDVFLGTGMTAGSSPDGATGPMPADDDSSFAGGGGDESGSGATGDDAVARTPGAPRLDPPPTTLQVVEYYHLDALGSVRAVTDKDSQVIARHDFLPFGDELSPQNPPKDRKLFTGQERDFETGLDYFHARQLRVDLGRFTAPDPLTDLAWTDAVRGATNAYGYVQSNPLGFIDPSGASGESKKKTQGRSEPVCDAQGNCHIFFCDDAGNNCQWLEVVNVSPAPSVPDSWDVEWVPDVINFLERLIPSRCGGGGFAYASSSLGKGPVQLETIGLVEYDSREGGSHGGVVGLEFFKLFTVGVESLRTWNDGQAHTGPIAIGGLDFSAAGKKFGKTIKPGTFDAGGFLSWTNSQLSVGVYVGGKIFGGGGYANLSGRGCSQ